jgi:type IV pilus assembly protein PilA
MLALVLILFAAHGGIGKPYRHHRVLIHGCIFRVSTPNWRWFPTCDPGEDAFGLIEVLVVCLIVGILAAVALPALLSQTHKAYDSSAKTNAQAASIAVEAWHVERASYNEVSVATLHEEEPSLEVSGLQVEPEESGAGYLVVATAANTGDQYGVRLYADGHTERFCASEHGGCPGHTDASESW